VLRRPAVRGTLPYVTVCLASYSPTHGVIIAVSDTMLSNEGLASDGANFKSTPLDRTKSWFAFYAGYPTEFSALVRHISTELSAYAAPSFDDVLTAASRAYAVEIARIGDMRHLAPLGMTRESFFQQREAIGEAAYARVFEALAGVSLTTELLICGFDREGGHIASTKSDGVYEIHDSVGFYAIGEGSWLALAALFADPKFRWGDLPSIVNSMCGAKFAAERSPSVGAETVVFAKAADGRFSFLLDRDLELARQEWTAATRAPRPSQAVLHSIATALAEGPQRAVADERGKAGEGPSNERNEKK